MGWRYKAGLMLIAAVVIIWVTSAEVTQGIFTDYKQPFAVTYLGASLMVVYLPVAFIKDWICRLIRKRSSRSGKHLGSSNTSSGGLSSPLKYSGAKKIFEIEIQGSLNRKDSELDLSADEEGNALVPKHKDDVIPLNQEKELTTREIAIYGFYIAPIWFITESWESNPSLQFLNSIKMDEVVIANGFVGSVLSDYFWALCVVWTIPLVATLGMSLTIPLAMVADMLIHGRHYSAIYILGSVQITSLSRRWYLQDL